MAEQEYVIPEMSDRDKVKQAEKLYNALQCVVQATNILGQDKITLKDMRKLSKLFLRASSLVTSVEHRMSGWPDVNRSIPKSNV